MKRKQLEPWFSKPGQAPKYHLHPRTTSVWRKNEALRSKDWLLVEITHWTLIPDVNREQDGDAIRFTS